MKHFISFIFFGVLVSGFLYAEKPKPVSKKKNKISLALPKKRHLEDKLLAIIYHPEETVLICQSDLKESLAEKPMTLRDAILRELIILDGKKLKITVTDAQVNRYIARIQEQLKLTKEGLENYFKKQGLSVEQARKELEKSILIENVMEARVRGKAHISKFDIEEYYQKNPQEYYALSRTFVSFNGGSKALARTLVERDIASGTISTNKTWQDVGKIGGNDFAPDKAYIKNLKPGSVVIADETDEGLVLLRLDDKKIHTFEERKNEIAAQLNQERFQQVQSGYFQKLLQEAKIRYIS